MRIPNRIVEHTDFLNVNDLKQLDPGTYILKWNNHAININKQQEHVVLDYVVSDKRIKANIGLATTKVGYGIRTWFNCPKCVQRTSKLYLVAGMFKCRECHNLIYLTSRRSGNELSNIALKVRRLQQELGMNTDDVHERALFKPRYMHQQTFDRLRNDLGIVQLHFMKGWLRIAS